MKSLTTYGTKGYGIKAGVYPYLNGILGGSEKGLKKEKQFWNTTRQLIPTQEHSRLSGVNF